MAEGRKEEDGQQAEKPVITGWEGSSGGLEQGEPVSEREQREGEEAWGLGILKDFFKRPVTFQPLRILFQNILQAPQGLRA